MCHKKVHCDLQDILIRKYSFSIKKRHKEIALVQLWELFWLKKGHMGHSRKWLIGSKRRILASIKQTVIPESVSYCFLKMNIFVVLISLLLAKECLGFIRVESDKTVTYDKVTKEEMNDCFTNYKEIAKTSLGFVYVIESREYGFKYVLKTFGSKKKDDYEAEAKVHSLVPDSPYFPKLYGCFEVLGPDNDKIFCILMEYVEGKDLVETINRSYRIAGYNKEKHDFINWLGFIAAELATAIQLLHDNLIVHRDIKLENIIIDQTGHLKLIDFGLSIKLEEPNQIMNDRVGTLSFIAPEVYEWRDYTSHIDWYNFGTTLAVLSADILDGDEIFYEKREGIMEALSKILDGDKYQLIDSCTRKYFRNRIRSMKYLKRLNIFKGICWEEMKTRTAQPPGKF